MEEVAHLTEEGIPDTGGQETIVPRADPLNTGTWETTLVEKASTLPVIQESGLPIKGTIMFPENHQLAGRNPQAADLAMVSAIEDIIQDGVGGAPSISLSIALKRDPSSLQNHQELLHSQDAQQFLHLRC